MNTTDFEITLDWLEEWLEDASDEEYFTRLKILKQLVCIGRQLVGQQATFKNTASPYFVPDEEYY